MTAAVNTLSSLATAGAATTTRQAGRDWASLGQADFIKLLTAQLSQQDPTDPVDNKEMLAQMAQFSQLSGITEMGTTLKAIEAKLDALAAARTTPV